MATVAPRPKAGPLLFVPARWQRVTVLKWLKRVHAWTGLWGALLFLGLGGSGFLLNHRSLLKIDTGIPRETSKLDVAVAAGRINDNAALDAWAKATLGLSGEGRTPPAVAPGPVTILGRRLPQAERLTRVFMLVDGRVTVSAVPGSTAVTVTRDGIGVLSILKNLHKGTGLGVVWVLLVDTIAGALVTMSVTGMLLWSRLHGRRLTALALIAGSLAWGLVAATPYFSL